MDRLQMLLPRVQVSCSYRGNLSNLFRLCGRLKCDYCPQSHPEQQLAGFQGYCLYCCGTSFTLVSLLLHLKTLLFTTEMISSFKQMIWE